MTIAKYFFKKIPPVIVFNIKDNTGGKSVTIFYLEIFSTLSAIFIVSSLDIVVTT